MTETYEFSDKLGAALDGQLVDLGLFLVRCRGGGGGHLRGGERAEGGFRLLMLTASLVLVEHQGGFTVASARVRVLVLMLRGCFMLVDCSSVWGFGSGDAQYYLFGLEMRAGAGVAG